MLTYPVSRRKCCSVRKRRDRLAKERWRFRQVQTPQAKVPLLAAVIGELETVQGIRLKPSPSPG